MKRGKLMGSSLKRIGREAELKKRKEVRKKLKDAARHVSAMPKQCSACKTQFDPKEAGSLDSWRVSVGPEGTHIICPSCFSAAVQSNPNLNNQQA